jgi:hypothetical protein
LSETGHLLDTNVVSEFGHRKPDPRVVEFVRSLDGASVFISVLTLGELRKGAEMKRRVDERAAARIDAWIAEVEDDYSERTLSVDRPIADVWGRLAAMRSRQAVDALIAATAIVHDLTLVTRNTRDFADTGVALVNPWE